MATSGYQLQPTEIAWLEQAEGRLAASATKQLDSETNDELALLRTLISQRAVGAADRLGFIDILYMRRKELFANWAKTVQEEAELIENFFKHLFLFQWETLASSEELYDPTQIWGGFNLTEAEIRLVINCAGKEGVFVENAASLRKDSQLIFVTENGSIGLRIVRIQTGAYLSERLPGGPPARIFEGVIMESSSQREPGNDGIFGALFTNGIAYFVDDYPYSGLTDRRIRAMLAQRS